MQPVTRFLCERFVTRDRRRLAAALTRVLAKRRVAPKPRRLYGLIDEGCCDEGLAGEIAAGLGEPDGTSFRAALRQSGVERASLSALVGAEASEDPRFISRPHLWIRHERTLPQPLFPVALTGLTRWKVIELPPDIQNRSRHERQRVIRARVVEHYRETGSRTGLFGRAVAYVYCPDPERSYRVTTTGRIDSLNLGPFSEYIPRIGMGRP